LTIFDCGLHLLRVFGPNAALASEVTNKRWTDDELRMSLMTSRVPDQHGPISHQVSRAMCHGALAHSLG